MHQAGTFKPNSGTGVCSGSCPANTMSAAGSVSMQDCLCNNGYTGENGGRCNVCLSGKFKDTLGSGACTSCPAGTFSAAVAATTPFTCSLCAANSFAAAGSKTCTSCPIHSVSSAGNRVITGCVCSAGFSGPDGGSCSSCDVGRYKATRGSAACTSCPTGSNSAAASDALGDCTCNAGSSGPNGGPCSYCAVGSSKKTAGSTECLQCPVSKYSDTIGSTLCSSCTKFSSSSVGSESATECFCNAGYSGGRGQACIPCPQGSYYQISNTSSCKSCQSGYTTDNVASLNSDSCMSCARGKFSQGREDSPQVLCLSCPANSMSRPAAVTCVCVDGWKGDRCLIRVKQPPPEGTPLRDFLVSFPMNLPVQERRSNINTAPTSVHPILQLQLSEFFSCDMNSIEIGFTSARRDGFKVSGLPRSIRRQEISVEIQLLDDYVRFVKQKQETQVCLRSFLGDSVQVSDFSISCGRGFYKTKSEDDESEEFVCVQCASGKYKSSLDDQPACDDCPSDYMYTDEAAVSPDECQCDIGFSWGLAEEEVTDIYGNISTSSSGPGAGPGADQNGTTGLSPIEIINKRAGIVNTSEDGVYKCIRGAGVVTPAEAAAAASAMSNVVAAVGKGIERKVFFFERQFDVFAISDFEFAFTCSCHKRCCSRWHCGWRRGW